MPSVLIVDDAEADRLLIKRALVRAGIEVTEAATPDEAAAIIRDQRPDVVIADLIIPPYEGADALTVIVGHARSASVPVVALSGLLEQEAWRAVAKQAGAVTCVAKGDDGIRLLPIVVEIVQNVQRQRGTTTELRVVEIAETMLKLAEQTEAAILAIADSDERSTVERSEILSILTHLQALADKIEAIEAWTQRQWTLRRMGEWWATLSPATRKGIAAVALPLVGAAAGYLGIPGVQEAIGHLFAAQPGE